ncbi:MAG: GAF domain-containing protein [Solirubrobacteraceae bacterium]
MESPSRSTAKRAPGATGTAPAGPEVGYREAIRAFGALAAEDHGQRPQELDSLLHAIARKLCELLGVRRASVYLRDDRGRFKGEVGHDASDIDARVKRLVAGVEGDRFTREILASMRPVVVRNALEDPRPLRSTMREWGVVSMLGVPMIAGGEVLGILFADDGEAAHVFSAGDCDVALAFAELAAVAVEQARRGERLRSSVKTVVRQNQRLRRSAALGEQLAAVAIEGAAIEDVLSAVAKLTGRPLSLHDASGARRALAVPPGVEFVPRLLDAEHRDHPAVREALATLDRERPSVVAPILSAGLTHRHLLVPVAGGERRFGELVMLESGSALTSLDVQACAHAARILALRLAFERDAAGAEDEMRARLAADLLRGDGETSVVRGRAAALGLDLDRPHVVCVVAGCAGAAESVEGGVDACAIAEALSRLELCEPPLLAPVAGGLAIVLALETERAPRTAIAAVASSLRELLAPLRRRAPIAVALSGCVRRPDGYATARLEAGQVLRCVERHAAAGTWLLSADDLGAARLMLSCAEPAEVDRFAQDALGAIASEREPAGNLLGTLHAFFERSRSVKASAASLRVHENTIRYRLARIQELTGLDVAASSEDQLTAQVALRVLQLHGSRPWSLTPPAAGAPTPPPSKPGSGA